MRRHEDLLMIINSVQPDDRRRLLNGPLYYLAEIYGAVATLCQYDGDTDLKKGETEINHAEAPDSVVYYNYTEEAKLIWLVRNIYQHAIDVSDKAFNRNVVPDNLKLKRLDQCKATLTDALMVTSRPIGDTLFYRMSFELLGLANLLTMEFGHHVPKAILDSFINIELLGAELLQCYTELSRMFSVADARRDAFDKFYFDVRRHQALDEAHLTADTEEYPEYEEPTGRDPNDC